MLQEDKFFQTLSEEELWQRYCGFLDFSVDEFMEFQEHLLLEQIDLVADSLLGKKIMQGNKPKSVEEFRRMVPLTTYDDYEPYLSEHQEDALAVKPLFWCHSAGRGGQFKWVPYTKEGFDKFFRLYLGFLILGAANRKGEVKIKPGERVLLNAAPRPYASGMLFYHMSQAFSLYCMPPFEIAEAISFQERIQMGFQMALRAGVDDMFSIASVLVKAGERMAEQAQGVNLSPAMLHPRILFTTVRAWLRSRLDRRPMLPKDIWNLKSILTVGTDTAIYKEDIAYYWGKEPYEIYGSTEAPGVAANSWNKKWLTVIPYCCFWEFIPEEESIKLREDKSYHPSTVLTNELEEGKIYEVVATQFYGMPLLRYKMGDVVKVVALSDDEAGVNLPQIMFHARVGETIDLAGLARLTEKVIWQAIANTGVKYEDWSARKEYDVNKSFVHLYIELKEEREAAEIERLVDEQLKIVDVDYRDIDSYLELKPVKVTLLSPGTFGHYYQQRVKEGADLAHLKPPHMNAPDAVIEQLLRFSR